MRTKFDSVFWCLASLVTALAIMPAMAIGPDKSGISPNTISVPKGPGSIEGLGEAFQPTLNTGTAKHSLSFALPPGPAGHAPSIGIAYEGGSGNGPIGFGWHLTLLFVQRQTEKGIPRYVDAVNGLDDDHDGIVDEADELDRFVSETKEELIGLANGDYFAENEASFIRYRRQGAGWVGTLPNGTLLVFGASAATQITDGTRVFRWLVESSTDTNGNVIRYIYADAPGSANLHQKYLARIEYGAGSPPWAAFHFIAFSYGSRRDSFEDCRAGFPVRTGQRLIQVSVCTQGVTLPGHQSGDRNYDGITDALNRRYDLSYWPYAGDSTHWSYLNTVILIGADGTSALPPARYSYSVCNPATTLSAEGKIIGSVNTPNALMDNPLTDLIDLNGDGLPDIIKTDSSGGAHYVAYNLGEQLVGGSRVIVWSAPTEVPSADGQAWNINLQSGTVPGEATAHLADMDADGLADLVYHTPFNEVFYFKNLRRLGWGNRTPMAITEEVPPSPFQNANTKTADIDFDKKIDIIQSQSVAGGAQYRVWYNLGAQRYSEPVTIAQDEGMMLAAPTVQLVDWNGDRMADLVNIRPNTLEITPSYGHGNFGPLRSVVIPEAPLEAHHIAKASLRDITGDGLPDLIVERPEPGVIWYWINLGNDTLDTRRSITGLPAVDTSAAVRWADINGNTTTDYIIASSNSDPTLQGVDLGELIGNQSASNLLTGIDNGMGRVTHIDYVTSTEFALIDAAQGAEWSGPLPFPVSVVSRVVTSDSLGHSYETRFAYHDGFYDGVEQEFRGFGGVDVSEIGDASAPTLVTLSMFDTGRTHKAMKGRLLRLITKQESGAVFTDEVTTYAQPPRLLYNSPEGREVRFAVPIEKRTHLLEAGHGSERLLITESDFDNYGNTTEVRNFGIVEGENRSAFDDERFTHTQYAINLSAWILRSVSQVEVTDENGVLASRTRLFYDDESFSGSNAQQVTQGHLTLRQEWSDPTSGSAIKTARTRYDVFGNPITLLDPLATNETDGHVRRIAWDNTFHTFPITESVQLGAGKPALVYRAEYDFGHGRITASVDFNSNRTHFSYDAFGRLISLVKPGDTEALPTAEYDYQLATPYGASGLVNFTETRNLDRDASAAGTKRDHYFITRSYIDGLGRTLMTKTEAEPASAGGAPRVAVSGALVFNARTKPAATLPPFFSTLGGSLDDLLAFENIESPTWKGTFANNGTLNELGLAAAPRTFITYDAAGRESTVTNADGTQRRTEYEPLITRSIDEEDSLSTSPHFNTPMVHHQDGLGRLVRVDEVTRINDNGISAGGLNTWTTSYRFDLNDQLSRITDSQGNIKHQSHDGLKRLVSMNDPDRGSMSYTYDEASNLVQSVDAKGQITRCTFDGANRLLSEDYLDESLPHSQHHTFDPSQPVTATNRPDVAYFYDTAVTNLSVGDGTTATARNVAGRLAFVWDLSGEEHTSYDERGRTEWVVKRIADPLHNRLIAFRTGFTYDSLDRVRRVQYPDGDFVPYEYNERSLLAHIAGGPTGSIVSGLDYLPSGQLAATRYGNNTSTNYAYDSRLRLQTLLTNNPEGSPLLHYGYTFDGVSNLRSITDQRPTSVIPAGDSRRNTQTFGHDDLYRIASVHYSFAAPEAPTNNGSINYRYDRIGNLLAQTSSIAHLENGLPVTDLGSLSYGGDAGSSARNGRAADAAPGPHALTRIAGGNGARSIDYDANGNTTQLDGMVSTWDFKDRLIAVENSTMHAEYSYDYSGRRLTKKVTAKATPTHSECVLYPGKHFEVREGEAPVKYIWNGDTRIARVTGKLSTSERVQRLRLAYGWNLLSLGIDSTSTFAKLQASAPDLTLEGYALNASSGTFAPLTANTPLPAGSILWVKASSSATLHLLGTLPNAPPASATTTAQGRFIATSFEPLPLRTQPASATVWRFTAAAQQWQIRFAPPLAFLSDTPATLPVGEALFVQSPSAVDIAVPDTALSIRYYHQDHLGSSAIITDATGHLVEETSYYPFGHPRTEHRPKGISEAYGFTQKERDAETGLNYFEARFLATSLGRFTRVDPLLAFNPQGFLHNPQRLNGYAYCHNNPLVVVDPTGLVDWDLFFLSLTKTASGVAETSLGVVSMSAGATAVGAGAAAISTGVGIVPGVGSVALGTFAITTGTAGAIHGTSTASLGLAGMITAFAGGGEKITKDFEASYETVDKISGLDYWAKRGVARGLESMGATKKDAKDLADFMTLSLSLGSLGKELEHGGVKILGEGVKVFGEGYEFVRNAYLEDIAKAPKEKAISESQSRQSDCSIQSKPVCLTIRGPGEGND